MVLLEAFGLASKELFDYNRENYKFDQEQRLERDMQRVEMQIERFDLFREDIEDLVKLTVDKMDMYHIVGALFLSFTALVYCEGIISGFQPPFFLGQYFLTVAASFVYLLLAVWLSMYASIASHSFGVRLRTRYVRLPIPNLSQIQSLTTKLSDFEQQGISKVMRIPFGPQGAQKWELQAERKGEGQSQGQGQSQPSASSAPPSSSQRAALPEVRLAEAGDIGFGREDILMEAAASVPGKHVELFRKLQAKWQCYDAYSRISMALGVNQMIQSVNYFVVGYTMIQTCSPSNGYAATIIFQGCTFGLAFLDIAGLRSWKIFALQLVGALPMLILVAMLTVANRGRSGSESIALLCPAFYASPLCAYVEALWLELFMLTAKPSDDEASLPRRFRTVLFLDVFGDAAFDPTEAEHAAVTAGVDGKMEELRDDATKREVQQRQAAKAGFALQAAQGALRCWEAVPQELLTGVQASQLQNLRQEYSMWRERYHGCYSKMKSRRGVPYDSAQQDARALRRWDELTPAEQEADEFYQALVGPLQRRADASQSQYYDVSRGCSVWTAPPGVTILDMQMALHRVQEAEYDVQMLLDIERGDLKLQEEKDEGLQTPAGVFRKKRAGHHRLPWKSVRRMTAVIQVCWILLGTQNLLSNFGWWFPSWRRWWTTSSRGVRRLSASDQEWLESFEPLSVNWPHGSFFDPSFLSCVETSHGSQPHVFIGNSYRQFALTPKNESSATISLSPISLQSLPAGATVLHCALESCTVVKLEEDGTGFALWHTKPRETSQLPSEPDLRFRIRGRPWRKLSGARVSCSSVGRLLPDSKGDCYLFAGWDGQRVPLVAIEASSTTVPMDLRPRVDAPLAENAASQCTRDVAGLHVSVQARSGDVRLWALLGRDFVQAWDLSLLEPIGHWKLPSLYDPSFEGRALCEVRQEDGPRLFLAGVGREPLLLSARLE